MSRLLDTSYQTEVYQLFSVLAEDNYWRTAIALTAARDVRAQQLLAKLQQDEYYRVVAAALESSR